MRLLVLCVAAAAAQAYTCSPGTYASGDACLPCLAGRFSERPDMTSCTQCQVGRYSTQPGASKRLACKVCPVGWYWPDSGAKATAVGSDAIEKSCTQCAAGHYQDAPNQRVCHECEPGTFREDAAATKKSDCVPCNNETMALRKTATGNGGFAFVWAAQFAHETCVPRATDCLMGAWTEFTRCTKVCGGGLMTRSRQRVRPQSNGGAACPVGSDISNVGDAAGTQQQVKSCNTGPCSALHTRYPFYEELQNGEFWEMEFDSLDDPDTAPGMTAECRWQKDQPDGPWAWLANAENIRVKADGTEVVLAPGLGDAGEPREIDFSNPAPPPEWANRRRLPSTPEAPYLIGHPVAWTDSHTSENGVVSHVEGWCCRATSAHHRPMGKAWCFETSLSEQQDRDVVFWGKKYQYSTATGKMCHTVDSSTQKCAQFKPLVVHRHKCKSMTCRVEQHTCTKYMTNVSGICETSRTLQQSWENQGGAVLTDHPGYCPNAGWGNCKLSAGESHTSLRVTHSHSEDYEGHFCTTTGSGECECYCHNLYRNLAASPHFSQQHNSMNVTVQNSAKFGRNMCNKIPDAGTGAAYEVFATNASTVDFGGHTYRPVGPCKSWGCDVERSDTYSKSCDLGPSQPNVMSPALQLACENQSFTTQKCMSPTRSSQCMVNLLGNGGERATFFRAVNVLGSDVMNGNTVPSDTDGLYFYDYAGTELLHVKPFGSQFKVAGVLQNAYNYFGAVPESTAYVFLKGGGSSSAGADFTGIVVSFFTC